MVEFDGNYPRMCQLIKAARTHSEMTPQLPRTGDREVRCAGKQCTYHGAIADSALHDGEARVAVQFKAPPIILPLADFHAAKSALSNVWWLCGPHRRHEDGY